MQRITGVLLMVLVVLLGTSQARSQINVYAAGAGAIRTQISATSTAPSSLAAAFTPSQIVYLTSVTIYYDLNVITGGTNCTLAVEVWSGSQQPTTLLASRTQPLPPGTTSFQFAQFSFSDSTLLTPGQTYWISVRATAGRCGIYLQSSGGLLSALNNGVWESVPGPSLALIVSGRAPVPGACCNPAAAGCLLATPPDCVNFGGVSRGENAVCSPNLCLPVGACCRGASCTIAANVGCISAQPGVPPGRWLGAGTVCSPAGVPNACCPVDFDGSGQRSIDDIFIFLNGWFADCP